MPGRRGEMHQTGWTRIWFWSRILCNFDLIRTQFVRPSASFDGGDAGRTVATIQQSRANNKSHSSSETCFCTMPQFTRLAAEKLIVYGCSQDIDVARIALV